MKPCGDYQFKCQRCNVYHGEGEVYKIGRSGQDVYKCKGCNRLEGRMRTLKASSGKEFLASWDRLSQDELSEFMRESSELSGSALRENMQVFVHKYKLNTSSVSSGKTGNFYPLNYYREVMKFTEEQCQNIAKTCDEQWDAKLGDWTYCYDVEGRANEDKEELGTHAKFTPKEQQVPVMEKARSTSSSSSSSTSTSGDDQDAKTKDKKGKHKQKVAKKAKKEQQKQRKREQKQAKREKKAALAAKKEKQRRQK